MPLIPQDKSGRDKLLLPRRKVSLLVPCIWGFQFCQEQLVLSQDQLSLPHFPKWRSKIANRIFPYAKMFLRVCWWSLTSTSTCPRDEEPQWPNQSEDQETLLPEIHADKEGPSCSSHQRMKKSCADGGCLPSHLIGRGDGVKGGSRIKYLHKNSVKADKGETELKASKENYGKRVFSYEEAPSYLRFNPFITGGYRASISPQQCIQR